MRRLMLLVLMLMMATGLTGVFAQDDGAPAVEEAIMVREIMGGIDDEMAVLAPDGSYLAFPDRDGSLCLYALDAGETTCTPLPDAFEAPLIGLTWSPDGSYLAFTENAYTFLIEPDIWVMDVAAAEVTNLTDDGAAGAMQTVSSSGEESANLDVMPFWGPDTTLYFLRTALDDSYTEEDLTLMRIDPAGGAAESVMVLVGATYSGVYESRRIRALHGPVVLSPDGTTLAVNILAQPVSDNSDNGIWLYDLSGEDTPRHVLALEDIAVLGMPEYRAELGLESVSMWPVGLAWAMDGTGLVVSAIDLLYSSQPPSNMTYYVDIASGVITSLIDFSGMGIANVRDMVESESLLSPQDTLFFDVPLAVAIAPDGKRVFIAHQGPGPFIYGLSVLSLPPEPDVAPTLIFRSEELTPANYTRSAMSADGRYLLLAGYVYVMATE